MAGLQSAQAGMLVTSQNVTGASVDGYVRRTANTRVVGLSPSTIELTGTSFAVEGFSRFFDNLLQGQLLSQQSKTSYTTALTTAVASLDAMLTEPATSVATALGNFFNAAGSLANEPDNYAYQQSLIGNARQVADRVRGLAEFVHQIGQNASQSLADVLNQANTLAPQLASVNAKIRAAATPGLSYPSADLLDERDRIVQKLQDLIGGQTQINEDGTASYLLNGQHLVDREMANTFANASGSTPVRSDLPLSNLRLKVATVDGRVRIEAGRQVGLLPVVLEPIPQRDAQGNPMLDANGNSVMLAGQSMLQDGKAGAYVHLIRNFVPSLQKSIDLLAAQLVRKVNQITTSEVTGSPAIAPIFGLAATSSGGAPLTGAEAVFDSLLKKPGNDGDYSYAELIEMANPQSRNYRQTVDQVLQQDSFDARLFSVVGTFDASQFTHLRSDASATLEALRETFSQPVTFITSSVATTIATWKNDHRANEALQKSLSDQKSAITGVNLDEEAANLVKYQQLYNASSKLIQTGRQMFDTLLAMLSGQ